LLLSEKDPEDGRPATDPPATRTFLPSFLSCLPAPVRKGTPKTADPQPTHQRRGPSCVPSSPGFLLLSEKDLKALSWFPESVGDILAFRVEQWSDITALVKCPQAVVGTAGLGPNVPGPTGYSDRRSEMPGTVRRATPDDVERIIALGDELRAEAVALDARYAAEDSGLGRAWRVGALQDELRQRAPPELFVAEDGGHLLGFVRADRRHHTLHVHELYVLPRHRRSGVGRALFEVVAQRAREDGLHEVTLGTLARAPHALAFWEALGFAPYWVQLDLDLRGS
jgi:GNAT superfamily N-acetyltransferase